MCYIYIIAYLSYFWDQTKSPGNFMTLDIPRLYARWVLSHHFHGSDKCWSPYQNDVRKIIHATITGHIFIITRWDEWRYCLPTFFEAKMCFILAILFYSPKTNEKTSMMPLIAAIMKPPICELATSTIKKINTIPSCSTISIPRRTKSGANA